MHYDYDVRSNVVSLYGQGEWRFLERWRLGAGLRAEWVTYEYDNRMLDGNTDENGVPCGSSGCLYSRPADRTDHFQQLGAEARAAWSTSRRGSSPTRMPWRASVRPR